MGGADAGPGRRPVRRHGGREGPKPVVLGATRWGLGAPALGLHSGGVKMCVALIVALLAVTFGAHSEPITNRPLVS
jgi:hypothetical protein